MACLWTLDVVVRRHAPCCGAALAVAFATYCDLAVALLFGLGCALCRRRHATVAERGRWAC